MLLVQRAVEVKSRIRVKKLIGTLCRKKKRFWEKTRPLKKSLLQSARITHNDPSAGTLYLLSLPITPPVVYFPRSRSRCSKYDISKSSTYSGRHFEQAMLHFYLRLSASEKAITGWQYLAAIWKKYLVSTPNAIQEFFY